MREHEKHTIYKEEKSRFLCTFVAGVLKQDENTQKEDKNAYFQTKQAPVFTAHPSIAFVTARTAYTSINKTKIISVETELSSFSFFHLGQMCLMFTCVLQCHVVFTVLFAE